MFGEPPSGTIPILFNDQHVYTKPDRLKHRRVLAALVRGNAVMIPLRSMFEQMGARVSWNPNSRTVDVSKPGTDIQLTVGKKAITINGQESPLDVPAEMFRGAVVVPVRVISEGMGAYVQWVADRHVVVIRYEVTATTPLPSAPPVVPTPVTTPAPAQAPAANAGPRLEHYVGADFIISPKVYNELSPGNEGRGSYDVNGNFEFSLLGPVFMIGGDYRHVRYDHNAFGQGFQACTTSPGVPPCNTVVGNDPLYLAGPCVFGNGGQGCVTVPGFNQVAAIQALTQVFVPTFTASEDALNAHLGIKVADPHVYVAVAYYRKSYDYLGYPAIGGIGVGLDKLPQLDKFFSLYGEAWYFPNVSGTYHFATSTLLGPLSGAPVKFGYSVLTYDGGGAFSFGKDGGAYLRAGFRGERFNAKDGAPSATSVAAPYVGLGIHF